MTSPGLRTGSATTPPSPICNLGELMNTHSLARLHIFLLTSNCWEWKALTSLQPFSPGSLPNQLDIFYLVRLSALEDGAGIDYSYNNYEHAAAASDHNSDVVSYGTWTKRRTRLNKTAAKFCHFYHTFQKAFKSTKTVLTYPLLILETHDWTINQPCRSFLFPSGF